MKWIIIKQVNAYEANAIKCPVLARCMKRLFQKEYLETDS